MRLKLERLHALLAVFVIGVSLILGGQFFYKYCNDTIVGLVAKLSEPGLPLQEFYAAEGSLHWWQNQTLNVYGPLAFYALAAGIALILGVAVYGVWIGMRVKRKQTIIV